jgi:AcrR family transcriptional regulator
MSRSSADTREHVLSVAHELFYWHGIRATGVDRVAAEAGVAPTTLYRLFASKDDMVAAYIERADRLYRAWFDAAARAGGADPRQAILAVFDALGEQVQPQHCRGCPFLMALAEFPDPAHPAHRAAVTMKTWVRDRFASLAAALAHGGPGDHSELLADQLSVIMEGVYASAQALTATGPGRHARTIVESVLNVTCSPGRPAG